MPIYVDRPSGLGDAEFPLPADRARISRIARDRLLWQSRHEEVFTTVPAGVGGEQAEILRRKWASLDYVTTNLLGYLSRDTGEALSLEPAAISSENEAEQAAIDDIRKVSMWDSMILDAVEQGSALGEVCLKAYEDEDGIHLDSVAPDQVFRGEDYFAEYAALNSDPRKTVAPFVVSPVEVDGQWYVLLEIHEPGMVLYRAHRWDIDMGGLVSERTLASKGKLGDQVELEVIGRAGLVDYETEVPWATLLVIHNEPDPLDPKRGRSDYFPFGPSLAIGTVVVILAANPILRFYGFV